MARFMREHAGVALTLEVANTEEIARQVANFEIDVGLIEGEVDHPDLETTPWRDDELVGVLRRRAIPLARKRALHDDDLRAAAWIVREPGSGTRQAFDRAMRGLLPQLRIALSCSTPRRSSARSRPASGSAASRASRSRTRSSAARSYPVAFPHRDFRRQFYFLLHKRKQPAPARGRALARLLSRGDDLNGDGVSRAVGSGDRRDAARSRRLCDEGGV